MRTGVLLTVPPTLALLVGPAASQDGPNPYGRLTFTQELRLSDNPDLAPEAPGATVTSRTGLGFEYGSQTRVDSLTMTLGTDLEGRVGRATDRGDRYDFVNTRASLAYVRDGANAGFDLFARHSNTPFEDLVIGTEIDPDALVIDTGSRSVTQLALGFDVGRRSRTSVAVDLDWLRTDYLDTIDPDLVDSETTGADAVASFVLRPALVAQLKAGISETDEDDGTTRRTSYVGAGLVGETRGGFTFSTDVTYDRARVERGGSVTENDGIGFLVALTQDRPAGDLGLRIGSRVDDAGRSSSLSVSRNIDLPLGGLAFSVGIEDTEDADPGLIGSVAWTRETPDGALTASLTRETRSDDGASYADTRLSLSYAAEINEVSGWTAGIDFFSEDELSGRDDGTRTSASVAYRRELTDEWSFNTGYEYTRVDNEGDPDRTRNSVFFNVQRDVTFGF